LFAAAFREPGQDELAATAPGEHAPKVCATMKHAQTAKIENAGRPSLEKRPADTMRPVPEFLLVRR
jgi:hypothetical protein